MNTQIQSGDRYIILRKNEIISNDANNVEGKWEYPSDASASREFDKVYDFANPGGPSVDPGLRNLISLSDEEDRRNPDSRNRWAKQLGSQATYDAAKLLDLIRPEVEKILIIAGFTTPPSQSMRVRECLECMHMRLSELMNKQDEASDPQLNMRQRVELRKTINTLEAFQAVHKTITILEGTVI